MASAKPLSKKTPEAKGGSKAAAGKKPLQKKLEVGGAGDHFEREADHVARQVVRGGGGAPVAIPPTITPLGVQRKKMTSPASKKDEDKKAGGSKVQRKPAASMPKKEDDKKTGAKGGKKAQRKEAGATAGGAAPAGVESSIGRMQSATGSSLDGGTRGFMESRFGRDFSGVRVHHGAEAATAASALHARAFTVGNDVFFNSGEYTPHSSTGRELLAHELTHTVQQAGTGGVAARKVVQRAPPAGSPPTPTAGTTGPDAAAPPATTFVSKQLPGASIDTTDVNGTRGTITLPALGLPSIGGVLKGVAGGPAVPVAAAGQSIPVAGEGFTLNPVTARDDTSKAFKVWTDKARGTLKGGVRTKLGKMVADTPDIAPINVAGIPIYYLTFRSARVADQGNIFIGTLDELADQDAMLRPQWKPDGRASDGRTDGLAADHFLELQIGGADAFENMWLLESNYNSTVGGQLKGNIEKDLGIVQKEVAADHTIPADQRPQDPTEMKRQWTIKFTTVVAGANFPKPATVFWTQKQISDGVHLNHLKIMNEKDLVKAGLRLEQGRANPSEIKIFPSPAGGRMARVRLDANGGVIPVRDFLFRNIWAEGGTYFGGATDQQDGPLLTLNVIIEKQGKKGKDGKKDVIGEKRGTIDVLRSPRLGIAGYVSRESIQSQFSSMDFQPLSPLTFSDMGVSADGALIGSGNVLSSKNLFPKLSVPLTLYGDRILLNFPVPAAGMSLGPLTVTDAGLALGVGADGFFVEGYAGFMVSGLGHGSITADAKQSGLSLTGRFALDTDFLNPAEVEVTYDVTTDTLAAKATLGVPKGRIPGVDSGTVIVAMSRESIDVAGTINLAAPLAGTVIDVSYTKEKGLHIGAENIPLPLAKLPAVQNATMSIGAAKDANTGAWSISGKGQATLGVAGATGAVDIGYLDGMVTFHATAQVDKGPASGTLNFTATNGTIDDQGTPAGPPTDTITAWGKGSVTIKFGKIVQGTAGIQLTPDNRVTLVGEIAMPPVYEVFGKKEYTKDLLHLQPPEFPIWGVSVAGHGIGVFAFVDARISFNAFVGPGQIRNAAISATMDLDHPEAATVHGHGEFFVPAFAGLSLDVGGGLRARAAIAFAEGRVGLTGQLGIEADASAALDIDWNPTSGLALEATMAANARPKFNLFANASVTVGVDLLVTDVSHTFGPWVKELGSFGPDLELGVEFPVRWSEAKGLDLSLDNIVVHKPSLNAPALMSSVFDALAG